MIKEAARRGGRRPAHHGRRGKGSQLCTTRRSYTLVRPHTGGAHGRILEVITLKHLKAGWFVPCVHFQELVPISFWATK